MRTTQRILAVALLVAPALVTPLLAETPQPATPQTDTQVTLDDLLVPAQSVDVEEACNTPDPVNAASGFCPFGSPTCVVHDDCDDYCGSPEFGYCDIQGHFPVGCCLCLG